MDRTKINELMERGADRFKKNSNADQSNYVLLTAIENYKVDEIDFDRFTAEDINKAIFYLECNFEYSDDNGVFVCMDLVSRIEQIQNLTSIIYDLNQKVRPARSPFPFI